MEASVTVSHALNRAPCDAVAAKTDQTERRRSGAMRRQGGRLADRRSDQMRQGGGRMPQGHRSHTLGVLNPHRGEGHHRHGGRCGVQAGTTASAGFAAVGGRVFGIRRQDRRGCGRFRGRRGCRGCLLMLVAGHFCGSGLHGCCRSRRESMCHLHGRHRRRRPVENQGNAQQYT